jgi:hypothetical protein
MDIMRRLLIAPSAFALALALSSAAQAQSIGFKLGATMANQEFDPEFETSSITDFAGGGFVRFGLGRLGVQVEALSITKGSEDDADVQTKIEFIEVPLLLHLPLTMGQSFAPYIIAGPSAAFNIGCERGTAAGVPSDCDDEFEKTDFGLSAGGGLGFVMGPGAVLLEGRYTWGLKNINDGDITEIKNRSALFLVGYEIPIGGGR